VDVGIVGGAERPPVIGEALPLTAVTR
jgi:hypothetical protein